MKQRNRKRFDPAFKARVALAAVQERESLAQLGKKFGVHPVLVGQWKKRNSSPYPVGEEEKQRPAKRGEPARRTPRQHSPRPVPTPRGTRLLGGLLHPGAGRAFTPFWLLRWIGPSSVDNVQMP